jgi:hypothetical protein
MCWEAGEACSEASTGDIYERSSPRNNYKYVDVGLH